MSKTHYPVEVKIRAMRKCQKYSVKPRLHPAATGSLRIT